MPDGGRPVTLIRAKPLQVHLADTSITIRATADTVGAALAQGTYPVECGDPAVIGPVPVSAGTYYVVVKPTEDIITLECWKQYRLSVTTAPCNPAEGACCVGETASTMTKEDCGLAGGVWYGAGVDPARRRALRRYAMKPRTTKIVSTRATTANDEVIFDAPNP